MHNQKGFIQPLLIFIIVVAVIGVGGFFLLTQIPSNIIANPNPSPAPNPSPIACTQDAKLCPDGSYVGRTGPNCEFAQCPQVSPAPTPNPNPTEQQVILGEGQREGSLLVQKIYPNYITGLNFWEYPIATDQGQPITLYIGQTASNGCTAQLTLTKIEGKTATFIKKSDFNKLCPICLAENTLIDTPNGQIAVQDLQKGMTVWTVDEFGKKVSSTILKTSKTPVPSTHQMMHVVLDDGREVFASPGHPVGDGRIFNDLSVGQTLHGNQIITAEKISYDKDYTYDILPLGHTGLYFANSILIGSTLK